MQRPKVDFYTKMDLDPILIGICTMIPTFNNPITLIRSCIFIKCYCDVWGLQVAHASTPVV